MRVAKSIHKKVHHVPEAQQVLLVITSRAGTACAFPAVVDDSRASKLLV